MTLDELLALLAFPVLGDLVRDFVHRDVRGVLQVFRVNWWTYQRHRAWILDTEALASAFAEIQANLYFEQWQQEAINRDISRWNRRCEGWGSGSDVSSEDFGWDDGSDRAERRGHDF